MLKTTKNNQLWMVTQPDHAEVAGYLAAHWGNDHFARPGHYAPAPDAERLSAEVIFAVAQHDNGWWEWEATPDVSAADGFPLDLSEVLKDQQAGMNRWRNGLRRFAQSPLPNLLIEESRRFGRHTTVVVITPSAAQDWALNLMSLQGRGVKVAAVLLEADTFGGSMSPLDVYGTLAAGGVYAYTVKRHDDLSRALSEGGDPMLGRIAPAKK